MCSRHVRPAVPRRAPQALRTTLQPELMYVNGRRRGAAAAGRYALRALLCFCGSHYAAYARTDGSDDACAPAAADDEAGGLEAQHWARFDDAAVRAVPGGWPGVRAACARARQQPTLLLYERVPHAF
jgi:hypothetical protein